jgi:tetratricopeptide (TPR) repeat protein
MTNFQKLKHDARRAEQRSDWQRAIDLYRAALEYDAENVDLSIYNRIGDLHMRQGDTAAAVECYEQAAERYAEQGMQTSAIALCNKILRIAPDRDVLYRRLGGLHAQTGLLAEGRRCCMVYVDRATEQGRHEDALEAVEEFAAATGDEPIRLTYADRLETLGDERGAAAQLRSVHESREARGTPAADLLERIQRLDPTGETAIPMAHTDGPAAALAGSVDLASLVAEALDTAGAGRGFDPSPVPAVTPPTRSGDDGLAGVRGILGRFREQVGDALPDDDLAARYDLGVEYMTIGLVDEAVEEFQLAIAEPALVEAAHARLAECLALCGSEPVTAAPASGAQPERVAEAQPAAEPELGSEDQPAAPESAGTDAGPGGEDDEPSDELSGHYFRARLAQYRIRRAEERHTTDHAAHAELGTAYVEMDLLQEAVREFAVALKGPRPIAARAVRALRKLGERQDTVPELALHVVETLSEASSLEAAEDLSRKLAERWGRDHFLAERLDGLRSDLESTEEVLPDLESLFPGIAAGAPEAQPVPSAPDDTGGERGGEHLRELDQLLGELGAEEPSDEMDYALREDDEHIQALKEADELCAAGRTEDAEGVLHRLLDRLRESHRAREAMIVLDRLLVLKPEDVSLHEDKTELALMVNDRRALLVAYAELGACLQRQGSGRSARTAYGRILDFDPTNEQAKAAIAEIDRQEIELESRATSGRRKPRRPRSRALETERAELDVMLNDLGMDDDSDPDGEALAAGETTGSASENPKSEANSRYELGLAFRQMGMWEEAVEELRAALARLDEPSEALEALGESLHQAGRNEEAVTELESHLFGVDDDTRVVGALYFLAQALRAEGRDADARRALTRVEAASPGYRDAAQLLSELSH